LTIFFTPNGSLDLNTDPSDLPEAADGDSRSSGEMQRCKNLRLTENGVAQTRDGSRLWASGLGLPVWTIIEQGGTPYSGSNGGIYSWSTALETGLGGSRYSGIRYNPYNSTTQSIYILNGTDRKRIESGSVYEWGIDAPASAPTITTGGAAILEGDYNAKFTYCRKEGSTIVSESDPSPEASAAVTLSSQSLLVSWEAPADSQITHVRFYRTAAGGSTYYHDTDFDITDLSGYLDDTDSSLGTEVATNHDRPPAGSFVIGPNFNGVCFIIYNNLLYWCLAKQPDYWPVSYYIEVSPQQQPGIAACFWNGTLYYLSQAEIYLIQGTGANTFFPYSQSAVTGTRGSQAVESVNGDGIYHVGVDGVYRFATSDVKVTHGRYDRIFRGEDVNDVPGVDRNKLDRSWLIQFHNRMYFGYSGHADVYPTNVLVFDFISKKSWYYKYPWQISCVARDATNGYLLAGTADGYVYNIESPGKTTDYGTAISWELESKDFTLQTRAHFPRWVKYDIDASDADSATGSVVLDGSVHQTHTLSARSTRRRLVDTGNGNKESLRVSGSGKVKIYGIEAE